MSQGLNSRLCALNALVSVFDGRKPLDESLDKFAKKYDLSPRDKSFAHAICGFVLRYKLSLQEVINRQANRDADIEPSNLNVILLMAVAQIYLMDGVADHGAVDSAVELTRKIKCNKQTGLVNGILRNLMRGDTPKLYPNVPAWLFNMWKDDYGLDGARAIEMASLIQAKTGISNKNGGWELLDGELDLTPDQWVQDFASAMPVSLLGDDLTGKKVFDLCAAPGGKTMQLAARGAQVTAVDLSEKRLRRLQENLDRTNLSDNVAVECVDILKWKPDHTADIIILDAPCSATGTIRRHPDLPYIRRRQDIENLAKLQADLLDRAVEWLNPNGVLVYCTCSLQYGEGEGQMDAFFTRHKGAYQRVDISDYHDYQTSDGDIRLVPSYGDMDGFFISMIRKS